MDEKIKVLLVDDEKLERVLIRKGFPWEEYGFEIIGEAESGYEALEFMKNNMPQVLVTDISMPNMTGLELAEQVAQDNPDCYIVIVTGYRDFDYARQALKIGVEDFVLKPVNIDEIKSVAEKIKKKINQKNKRQLQVKKVKDSPSMPKYPWEEFTFAIANLLYDKVEELLIEYFMNMEKADQGDIEYLRLITMDILSKAGITLNVHGTDLFEIVGEEQLLYEIRMIQNVQESQKLIKKYIRIILDYHERKKKKQGNRVVEEALEYINNNYCNPELTLKMVAEKVYSNESYLSRVFKKEVGNSLVEYITKKRIDESIRLLNTTDLKVYEIAEKVGFRDPHYFSICFKKQVGITVKEFKNR